MVILMTEEAVLMRPVAFFRSPPPHLLQDGGENGSRIAVLGGVLAVETAQLLQARQLQGVQVRGVVLSQVPVPLKLQGQDIRVKPD